jgi:GT2 family glycosyltransferase
MFMPSVKSFLEGVDGGVLVISDNSEVQLTHILLQNPNVRYIFNDSNIGFGAAHNKAIAAIGEMSNFHLIMNPDIIFSVDVIPHLISVMQANPDIGAIMPRINYPDGSLQRLCKMLPTPVDLIFRRFIPIKLIQNFINHRYELHDLPQDRLVDVPILSGCFLIVRTEFLRIYGGFDEQYFMYLEDVDLVRRIGLTKRVVYDPRVSVTHKYAKGSYGNKKLLGYHIISAFRYFKKWGWCFDAQRKAVNAKILKSLKG